MSLPALHCITTLLLAMVASAGSPVCFRTAYAVFACFVAPPSHQLAVYAIAVAQSLPLPNFQVCTCMGLPRLPIAITSALTVMLHDCLP